MARQDRLSLVLEVGLQMKRRGGKVDKECVHNMSALTLCQEGTAVPFGFKRPWSSVNGSDSNNEQWWKKLTTDRANVKNSLSAALESGASGVARAFEKRARTKRDFIYAEDIAFKQASEQVYMPALERSKTVGNHEYEYIAESSNEEVAIFRNSEEIVVAIRGSTTQTDWVETDWMLVMGKLKQSPRYEANKKWVEQLVKSSSVPVVLAGHSLGGSIAIELVKDLFKEGVDVRAVVFNAATGLGQCEEHSLPIRHYSAKGDVVSALGIGKYGQLPKDDVLIDITSSDASESGVRAAHSMSSFMPPPSAAM